ncbi:MAG: hypothetical protein ACKOYM_09410, partial [Actinomycetes bacterium]
ALALCYAALLSTSNRGFWFAYPNDVLMVVGVLVLLTRLSASFGPARVPLNVTVATVTAAIIVTGLVAAWRPAGNGWPYDPKPEWRDQFASNLDALQFGNLEADHRLASTAGSTRRAASREWYEATLALADQVERLRPNGGPVWQSLTGEIHLFNLNTVALAEEMSGRAQVAISSINTLEPPDRALLKDLTPTYRGVPRVLVLVDGTSLPFPDGRDVPRYRRLALRRGWIPGRPVPLPDGGNVTVYTHPDSLP